MVLDSCAPCRLEVRQLTCKKQEQRAASLKAQYWADNMTWQKRTLEFSNFLSDLMIFFPTDSRLLQSGWTPRGIPIAYLHEHRAAINRLVSIPETSLFASSSADGSIKIWDVSKMEGRNIANRSR